MVEVIVRGGVGRDVADAELINRGGLLVAFRRHSLDDPVPPSVGLGLIVAKLFGPVRVVVGIGAQALVRGDALAMDGGDMIDTGIRVRRELADLDP